MATVSRQRHTNGLCSGSFVNWQSPVSIAVRTDLSALANLWCILQDRAAS
jgi:hypothetical protein